MKFIVVNAANPGYDNKQTSDVALFLHQFAYNYGLCQPVIPCRAQFSSSLDSVGSTVTIFNVRLLKPLVTANIARILPTRHLHFSTAAKFMTWNPRMPSIVSNETGSALSLSFLYNYGSFLMVIQYPERFS